MYALWSAAIAHWAALYSNHAALRTAVGFTHFAGLVGGGGCAVAADRATLLAWKQSDTARDTQLASIRSIHRVVLTGLALIFVSGLLLFAADLDTYLTSLVFWTKMGLVALLLANGVFMTRGEQLAATEVDAGWARLRQASIASLLLWFLTTLAGATLPNLG